MNSLYIPLMAALVIGVAAIGGWLIALGCIEEDKKQ